MAYPIEQDEINKKSKPDLTLILLIMAAVTGLTGLTIEPIIREPMSEPAYSQRTVVCFDEIDVNGDGIKEVSLFDTVKLKLLPRLRPQFPKKPGYVIGA